MTLKAMLERDLLIGQKFNSKEGHAIASPPVGHAVKVILWQISESFDNSVPAAVDLDIAELYNKIVDIIVQKCTSS